MHKTMAKCDFCLLYVSWIFILTMLSLVCQATDEERQVHIVYMGSLPETDEYSPVLHHISMLQEVQGTKVREASYVRSYGRSFNGFAAKLSNQEKQIIEKMHGVISVFPSKTLKHQTTRSWDFMGFHETDSNELPSGSSVIIGVIDTGIWPESDSFKDDGFGPPPNKWKGACKGGQNFTCNNKLIGARYYNSIGQPVVNSARDDLGHGSHVSSTAAGNIVKNVSFYGLATGNARGAVPSARIAAYKACKKTDCPSEDILAAFDDAISDGVDIISVSLGSPQAPPMKEDEIAIGSFHAMEKGILTVQSAGNNGPSKFSVCSVAPWLLTVAASSTDRRIISKVLLGNGTTIIGNAVNSFRMNQTMFPMIRGNFRLPSKESSMVCGVGRKSVEGKILVCDYYINGEAPKTGAVGTIYPDDYGYVEPLPSSGLGHFDFSSVISYMNSTKEPQGYISRSEDIKDDTAPTVASFSSRGPNAIVSDIMKPDLTAPGINILAAWVPNVSPSLLSVDTRQVRYNIISGTSMSCPHVTGAAAYVKTFHPDWSPSAIKSALMTTARTMNSKRDPDREFAYGSGHIDPVKAVDPGLIYDALKEDYIRMLCSIGEAGNITRETRNCSKISRKKPVKDLNYPSMTAAISPLKPFVVTFNRTLTNVGKENATYNFKIIPSFKLKIKIKVVPGILSFKSVGDKQSFTVTVKGSGLEESSMASATLNWSDGIHNVRSPIILYSDKPVDY